MTDRTQDRIEIRADFLDETPGPVDDGDLARRAETDEDLDLIEVVRDRLDLDDDDISDVSIAASLAQIATREGPRARWLAAFGSPLGKHLAMRGSDLNTALNVVLALAPRHL